MPSGKSVVTDKCYAIGCKDFGNKFEDMVLNFSWHPAINAMGDNIVKGSEVFIKVENVFLKALHR